MAGNNVYLKAESAAAYTSASLHGWFSHFIYQYKITKGKHHMASFVPKVPEEGVLFPPWKFEGRVKWGD